VFGPGCNQGLSDLGARHHSGMHRKSMESEADIRLDEMSKLIMIRWMPVFLLLTACATHRANYSYSELGGDTPVTAGPGKGDPIAMVEGKERGFVWTSCKDLSKVALKKLTQQARAKGGDSVAEVRWESGGGSKPSCRKRWGYIFLPVMLFTPAFAVSQADGVAYKSKPPAK
jgi:hypothetical protein